jgi:hypothetical protein
MRPLLLAFVGCSFTSAVEVSVGRFRKDAEIPTHLAGIPVLVIDVFAVPFVNLAFSLHLSTGFVSLCPTLLLLWLRVVLLLSGATASSVRKCSQ